MSRKKRPHAHEVNEFSDTNVQNTVIRMLEQFKESGFEEYPSEAHSSREALEVLVSRGCDPSILRTLSYAYALFSFALEENRRVECKIRPENRKIAFDGGVWRRKDITNIGDRSRELADMASRFLVFARSPHGDLRDNPEYYLFGRLPTVLRRFADYVERIGEQAAVVNELPAQRARAIADLEAHVRAKTERSHFSEIVELILGWRTRFPFKDPVTEDALRMQLARERSDERALPPLGRRDRSERE
jgi:hypothetical protein